MHSERIDFSLIPQISATDVAYANEEPALRKFYKYDVDLESFAKVISDRANVACDRSLLVEVLKEQYSGLTQFETVQDNIDALRSENAFTVVTAHQPCLLLGPLYFVYKIISAIRLSEELNARYPHHKIVPVFVIGGEDHDFAEINHARLFNRELVWQTDEKGAVGMMSPASLSGVLDELKLILGDSEHAVEIFDLVSKNYTEHPTYHSATQGLINDLFGNYGLLVLNMNDTKLKAGFSRFMRTELLSQPSKKLVEETQQELHSMGFKPQAFPREINMFYMKEQLRERIVLEDGVFKVLNTDIVFSRAEIELELENHPERFSPNVILRPIYQESVLPNLAYIGGGGELAYWLERKSHFQYYDLNFPMLIRRNSILWIDAAGVQKMDKLQLNATDLFQDVESLVKRYVKSHADTSIDLHEAKSAVQEQFGNIAELARKVDATLEKAVLAEQAKSLQGIEQLEARLLKAEKQRQETAVQQIRTLTQKYCPNGGLQERAENFIPYYVKYGRKYFDDLMKVCHPLEKGFVVIKS